MIYELIWYLGDIAPICPEIGHMQLAAYPQSGATVDVVKNKTFKLLL